MKITAINGDSGYTNFLGKRIRKDDRMIEALGTLDEAQAVLGGIGMGDIQQDLYKIMGNKLEKNRVCNLEKRIETLKKELKPVDKFMVFEEPEAVYINWARTVVRRAERRWLIMKDKEGLKYLNKLSGYLYLLARKAEEK